MRFLVDMPLTPDLIPWLTASGHNAVHAAALGLGMAEDAEILRRAFDDDRLVVTADLDFPRILALTHATGPTVILFRGGNYRDTEMVELGGCWRRFRKPTLCDPLRLWTEHASDALGCRFQSRQPTVLLRKAREDISNMPPAITG